MTVYVDTSALAKWYVNEAGSDEFEQYISQAPAAWISRPGVVESAASLARRRRMRQITAATANRLFLAFERDILATGDRRLATAAEALGMKAELFG